MKNAQNVGATVVLSLIALALPVFPHPSEKAQPQPGPSLPHACAVEILSPKPGDKVGQSTTVKGTANISTDGFLWILARKKGMGNQWWPQAGGAVEIDESHLWEAVVFLGRPEDIGSTFEVAAVVVSRQTNEELVNWFATAKALDYPPRPFPNSIGCEVMTIKVEKR